jgi:hypothetical protein
MDFKKYFAPRGPLHRRPIHFAEILKGSHAIEAHDVVIALGNHKNYAALCFRKGLLNQAEN